MIRKLIGSVFLLEILLACNNDEITPVTKSNLAKLETEIREMTGKDCSNSGQCEVIAFGSKPCGGPWEYLAYSSSDTDVGLLIEMVNTFNQLQEEYNLKNGIISDCAFVMPPEVTCADGQCQIMSN